MLINYLYLSVSLELIYTCIIAQSANTSMLTILMDNWTLPMCIQDSGGDLQFHLRLTSVWPLPQSLACLFISYRRVVRSIDGHICRSIVHTHYPISCRSLNLNKTDMPRLWCCIDIVRNHITFVLRLTTKVQLRYAVISTPWIWFLTLSYMYTM